uniref:CUB domain-containing protein n=2 Tax=Caenorhabditis japonica TaxID=281687 RepID=A0A8R1DMQ5_CAEJA
MQSWVQLQFVTNSADRGHRGFRIQYRIVSEAAIKEPLSIVGESMFTGCGGHSKLGQLSGEILSPGYPTTYPKNSTCNWLIRVEAQQRIYIRIVHLHLAPTIAECERASLTIIDGYKHESSDNTRKDTSETSQAKFCGSQLYYSEEGMKSYLSSANRIVVRLATQDGPAFSMIGEERIGFKIIWTAVEGLIGESVNPERSERAEEASCEGQFLCHGGQVCVEQVHGICASRSRLCIHNSLVCDGIYNCVEGDFSDEQHCYSKEIITSAACGFSLIVLMMLVLVCCDQLRKRRRLRILIKERRALENGKNGSRTFAPYSWFQPKQ